MPVNNVSLTAPTDYTVEAQSIERRRRLAEMLQKQSMEQQPTEMVSGWAIPQGALGGISKLAQALAGAYGTKQADDRQKALAAQVRGERADTVKRAIEAMTGTPERWLGEPGTADEIYRPAVAGNPEAGYSILAQSQDPMLAQVGLNQAVAAPVRAEERAFRASETAENRAARLQERVLALDAAATNAALSREERAARAAEAAQLRRELAAQGDTLRRELPGIMAANRPPVQPQPLVQIMGANGQPQWVERRDAIGKTPAGAGSTAEAKLAAKSDVDKDVVKLKSVLDALKSGGGITDTSKGVLSNIGAAIGSSAVGQTLSGAVGSNNQSARNELAMIRPSLLRSIMQATGMSARQMDSNAELKLWLSTATDSTKDYQSNISALNNIAKKYGSGGFLDDAQETAPAPSPTPQRRSTDKPAAPRVVDW